MCFFTPSSSSSLFYIHKQWILIGVISSHFDSVFSTCIRFWWNERIVKICTGCIMMIFVERKILVKIFPLFSLKTCAHFNIHLSKLETVRHISMANKITAFLHLYFILTEVYWQEYLCYWCLFIEIWTNMNIRFGFHFNCSHISNPSNILLQLYCVLCGTFLPYSLMKFINFQFSLLLYLSLSSSPSLRFVSISFCGSICISNWMWAVY